MQRYFKRDIEQYINILKQNFKVISIIGPRQSGKTTLIQHLFPNYNYFNLEDIEMFNRAYNDPKSIINEANLPLVIDEAHRVPHIFSQIQILADRLTRNGQIIVSGSSNILMQKNITQSLAGRVAIAVLLPFSISEITGNSIKIPNLDNLIFLGGYPYILKQNTSWGISIPFQVPLKFTPGINIKSTRGVKDFYKNYINTYFKKDLYEQLRIKDEVAFSELLKHLAYQTGQLINFNNLANSIGKSHHTIKEWIDTLTVTFVAFYLQPYHRNFKKRLVKKPKIFFYDTGITCYLTEISSPSELEYHPLYGQIFENFIIADYIKTAYHLGEEPHAFFWRNKAGYEIDLIIEQGTSLYAIEIKSTNTYRENLLKNLNYFKKIEPEAQTILIYKGNQKFHIHSHIIWPAAKIEVLWRQILKSS